MTRIDILPDDILLRIFDLYEDVKARIEGWQSLVHVCRRWRNLVFGSPRRLNLQLYCTPQTPVKERLDVWPALPLLIVGNMAVSSGTDNVIAALGQTNRVRAVSILTLPGSLSDKVLAPMQASFPELTILHLYTDDDEAPPVIPDSFLGGSAPRLEFFSLSGFSFLGLPKLLLSATQLTSLHLLNIPHSGYISPKAIVAALSALPGLKTLFLQFRSPQSRPDWENQSLPPSNRFILPALNDFHFKGVTEYLEELTTRIDAPQLNQMDLTFFNQIDFDCPRLARFIDRTPKLRALDEAHVEFDHWTTEVRLRRRTSKTGFNDLQIGILCREPDWQVSSIEQVCNNFLLSLPKVEDLYIGRQYSQLVWTYDAIENSLWFQLFLPFTAVKNLYLSKEFAPGIAVALYEGRMTDVLPSLQNIFVEELETPRPFHEYIEQFAFLQFVSARQLRVSNNPINISVWGGNDDEPDPEHG